MSRVHIFPGQGSQFPGMGKDIYTSSPMARELMEEANRILGFRITDIMFDGTEEELKSTKVTQPAVFLHSTVLALCNGSLPQPDMVAGHSLGEFSALAAAGYVSFEDALSLVARRAAAMQKCCEDNPGKMAAVIGLDGEKVSEICALCGQDFIAANFNSDAQTVISGRAEALPRVKEALLEAGAKKVIPLNVAGAFHSSLMEPARRELSLAIEATPFRKGICPIYQNCTGTANSEPSSIKENLISQLTSPVLWVQTIRNMVADGASIFVEIGPGNPLQGMIKRTDLGTVQPVIEEIQ